MIHLPTSNILPQGKAVAYLGFMVERIGFLHYVYPGKRRGTWKQKIDCAVTSRITAREAFEFIRQREAGLV